MGLRACHRRLRSGRVEHLAAVGRRRQHDRQSGHLRRSEAGQGNRGTRRQRRGDRTLRLAPGRHRTRGDPDHRDDAQRRVLRHRHARPGRGAVDRRQDGHGVQGSRQRHVLRRRRQPDLLRELRRVLPGREPPGHACWSRSTSRPAGTNDRFGGTAAAPVFAELAPTLIHELGIVPTPGAAGCQPP